MANNAFENNWTNESTNDRMNESATPGKVKEDDLEMTLNKMYNEQPTYDSEGALVPDSKEAGGNLAQIQDNIRDRFQLDTQDSFTWDEGPDKKLY